jgi:hypothetical protein
MVIVFYELLPGKSRPEKGALNADDHRGGTYRRRG